MRATNLYMRPCMRCRFWSAGMRHSILPGAAARGEGDERRSEQGQQTEDGQDPQQESDQSREGQRACHLATIR